MVSTYKRSLRDLPQVDFVEACDRIIFLDEWFPSIARIRAVTDECAQERRSRQRQAEDRQRERELASRGGVLTCPLCRGSRWLRTGKWSQGEAEIVPCGGCMTDGRYDARREGMYIARHGGVPAESSAPIKRADLAAKIAPFRMTDGRLDMDALYRHSRELRGLDPDIDERPPAVAGFMTIGEAAGAIG